MSSSSASSSSCFHSCFEHVQKKIGQDQEKKKSATTATSEVLSPPERVHSKRASSPRPLLAGADTPDGKNVPKRGTGPTTAMQKQYSLDQYRPVPVHPAAKQKPYFKLDERLSDEERSLPQLILSALYDIQSQSLTVCVREAVNLPTGGRKTCNPTLGMALFPNSEQLFITETLSNTTNPQWNQCFVFPTMSLESVKKRSLVARIYNLHEGSPNVFIGMVLLRLAEVDLLGDPIRMIVKKGDSAFNVIDALGALSISLEYSPDKGVLCGTIVRCHNIQKRGRCNADPYIKLQLLYRGKRVFKWKTSVKKNTITPVYNESFSFNVSGLDMREIMLQATIMDRAKVGKDESLGTVLIGEQVEHKTGKMHWEQMMATPSEPLTRVHVIATSPESIENTAEPELPTH